MQDYTVGQELKCFLLTQYSRYQIRSMLSDYIGVHSFNKRQSLSSLYCSTITTNDNHRWSLYLIQRESENNVVAIITVDIIFPRKSQEQSTRDDYTSLNTSHCEIANAPGVAASVFKDQLVSLLRLTFHVSTGLSADIRSYAKYAGSVGQVRQHVIAPPPPPELLSELMFP